jgi:glycosyltransferase involved in cell wall biosynthesis
MSDPKRIAMLVWSYWPGHEGGAERQCRKIIPHLAARGLDVVVWTAWTSSRNPRSESCPSCEIVRLGTWVPRCMATHRALARLWSGLLRGTAGKARRSARLREALSFWFGLPFIWAARASFLFELRRMLRNPQGRPDVIHVHESSWLAGAAAFLARRHGIPVLAKTAVHPALDALGYDVPFRRAFSRARQNCWFAALAQYQADDLAACGVSRDRIFLAPNGVDIPGNPATAPGSKDVLFVANFSQSVDQKAFDVLLEAWRRVSERDPSARLHLLGDGDRTQWEAMVTSMHLERSTHFAGWTPDPSEYYRQAALFVLPSRSEGMSNALLEAQSWGLACVVSDIPGNRAVIQDGDNGRVVPVGDARALADAILGLLADGPLRHRLGLSAREAMSLRFSLESVAARLHDIYRKVSPSRAEREVLR